MGRILASQFPVTTAEEGAFTTINAIDLAEQLTYLDHQIIMSISSE